MDISQLLNTSTPFDASKLSILEKVVEVMYSSSTSPQDRATANDLLDKFQNLENSYSYCEFILNNTKQNNTMIIALNILENFMKEKWNMLDNDSKINLRNFLVGLLLKYVCDNNFFSNPQNSFFINKLNILIVLIAKNEWTSTWPNFISELCTSSKSDPNLCENNMKILILLSEEINIFWKKSLTARKAYELREKMSKEFIQVFELCQLIIKNSKSVNRNLLIQAIKLFGEYMNWFPINLTLNQDIMNQTLLNFKDLGFCRTETMKCLGELFGIKLQKMNENEILQYKQLIIQMYQRLIQIMDDTIVKQKNFADQYKYIYNSNPEKLSGYEKMTLNFENCLINFFKSNISFIQRYDFIEGTQQVSDFISTFLPQINSGLNYMIQFLQIESEEIFKAAVDFWMWFSYKVFKLKDPEDTLDIFEEMLKNNNNIQINISKEQYLQYLNDSYLYKNCYMKVIDIVREIISVKMTKPLEVKIDIDENGDLVCDPTKNTVYQALHENMKETLIYLTIIDQFKTQQLLQFKINEQLDIAKKSGKINPSLLNSISWSAGCISGAMSQDNEMSFLVIFIRALLNLCEIIKGKGNKAICASNIMYVVGQYPRFLNNHWMFLKTVVKKLFEFMHESFEGVQDFACETFLKVSMKCAKNFIILQNQEREEYIKDLVRNVSETTKDLQPHQQLMFYEAIGNMINVEPNMQKKIFYIKQLMAQKDNEWNQVFQEAKQNINILNNTQVIKGLTLIIHLNERVSFSTKTPYWAYGCSIFENLIKSFLYYSNNINEQLNKNNMIDMNTRSYMTYNKTLIKFLTSLVKNTEDIKIIQDNMLQSFASLIEAYNNSNVNNKDPNMLLLFSAVLEKIQNQNSKVIPTIWNSLCMNTIQLIKDDYQSYPEHRMNFFILLKSLISYSFESLWRVQNMQFNKDVIDTILFAITHQTPQMFETGLETMRILLEKVVIVGNIDLQNIIDPFFKNYFFTIFNGIFSTMTDGFHQSGFKIQVKIIQILVMIIDDKKISENLFVNNDSNKNFFLKSLLSDILQNFKNITQTQGETFCLALFNSCKDEHKFKTLLRDFLISLKTFMGNNEQLWAEERNRELEIARQIEEQKKAFIPGPQYMQQINANNYQNDNI